MSNPVCAIFYREDCYEDWKLYSLAVGATTAVKMLIEDGIITKETLAYESNGKGEVAIGVLPVEDRVKFIVQALAHRNGWFLSNLYLSIKNVYDKDDYGEDDEYYGKCISSLPL